MPWTCEFPCNGYSLPVIVIPASYWLQHLVKLSADMMHLAGWSRFVEAQETVELYKHFNEGRTRADVVPMFLLGERMCGHRKTLCCCRWCSWRDVERLQRRCQVRSSPVLG